MTKPVLTSLDFLEKCSKQIKEAMMFIADLMLTRKRSIAEYVGLQKILKALEKAINLNPNSSISMRSLLRKVQHAIAMPQANLELLDIKTIITFDKEMFKQVIKFFRALFQYVIGVTIAWANNLQNLLQDVDANVIQQASARASERLAQNVVNKIINPKASVPSFKDIIRDELVNPLQLNETLANKLLNNISSTFDECRPSAPSFPFFRRRKGFNHLDGAKVINPLQEMNDPGCQY
jgi:hypothetical protein